MKKIIISTAMLTVALAQAASAQTSSLSGLFLGAAGGMTRTKETMNVTLEDHAIQVGPSKDIKAAKVNKNLGHYGAVLAAQTVLNKLFLGWELGCFYAKGKVKGTLNGFSIGAPGFQTQGNDSFHLRTGRTYSIAQKVGYAVNDQFAVYGIVGVVNTKFTLENGFSGNLRQETSKSQSLWGGKFGAGAEYALNSSWTVMAEYAYHAYSKFSHDFAPSAGQYLVGSFNPRHHTLTIGVKFKVASL